MSLRTAHSMKASGGRCLVADRRTPDEDAGETLPRSLPRPYLRFRCVPHRGSRNRANTLDLFVFSIGEPGGIRTRDPLIKSLGNVVAPGTR